MLNLSSDTLGLLPEAVAVPTYDRVARRLGIVHVGVGHFHRSHQAMYLDRLMREGQAMDWGVCGVSVLAKEAPNHEVLRSQDLLYTLTIKSADGARESMIVGSLQGYLYAPAAPGRVVEQIAHPDTRVVSLTITEGGYEVNDATREFQPDSPAVRADLVAEVPTRSVFGLVFQAAQLRRERNLGGLTVMSCDNIQDNGGVARTAFLAFAEARDPQLKRWMEQEFRFPSSMVDRVTPRTVDADSAHLEQAYGYRDLCPVTCEPFHQWVLEDDFAAGRPRLEDVGVQVVSDVEPYEVMKLRLANGTHQALCYVGHLLGYTYVHEAIADPDIRRLLLRYIDEEAGLTLRPLPGIDPKAYGRNVLERFANPAIQDPLSRICADASDRIPKFVLPVAAARLAAGARVPICAGVVAAWARYAEGADELGRPIEIQDPRSETVIAAARAQASSPTAFIEQRAIFGDLAESTAFVEDYTHALATIHANGVRATLRDLHADRA